MATSPSTSPSLASQLAVLINRLDKTTNPSEMVDRKPQHVVLCRATELISVHVCPHIACPTCAYVTNVPELLPTT